MTCTSCPVFLTVRRIPAGLIVPQFASRMEAPDDVRHWNRVSLHLSLRRVGAARSKFRGQVLLRTSVLTTESGSRRRHRPIFVLRGIAFQHGNGLLRVITTSRCGRVLPSLDGSHRGIYARQTWRTRSVFQGFAALFKVLLDGGEYCPWCRRKVTRLWRIDGSQGSCSRCGWGVIRDFWDYCPWCSKKTTAQQRKALA